MTDGKWTVLIFNEHGTGLRQFRLSRELMRAGIAAALLVFAVLVTVTSQVIMRITGPQHTNWLQRENAKLHAQLDGVNQHAGHLNGRLDRMSRNDEQFRLVAGLDPLPSDVLQAGIGGPDSETPERNPLWAVNHTAGEAVFRTQTAVSTMMRRANLLAISWQEATDSLEFHHERLLRTPSIQPTDGTISSAFNRWRFHPILNITRAHEGIDISAPSGTPIVAAAKGLVRFVGRNGEYGLMVEIDHGFNTVTRYAHASRLLARLGQQVQRGDTIALVGSTGLAVGPHVHYEVLVRGTPVNPRNYLLTLDAIPD